MDALTLEGILKLLPEATTYPGNEYYYQTTALDNTINKIVDVQIVFEKDPLEKKWIYVKTLGKKNPTQEH